MENSIFVFCVTLSVDKGVKNVWGLRRKLRKNMDSLKVTSPSPET